MGNPFRTAPETDEDADPEEVHAAEVIATSRAMMATARGLLARIDEGDDNPDRVKAYADCAIQLFGKAGYE